MRWKMRSIAICLGLTSLSFGQVSYAAQLDPEQVPQATDDQRAREIVAGIARLFIGQSSIATVEMQVIKPDLQRTISMQFWTLGESKLLVRVLQPQEDAGTAILKVGGKSRIYLPKARRTVSMPPSTMATSWMGSHFTLNDLVNQARLADDYAITTAFEGQRDGVEVIDYTLTPKPDAVVVWGKIDLEVRKVDLMPVWERYYDEDGELVRELSFSDYTRTADGRLIPTRLIMRPLDRPGEETIVTYKNVVFDSEISADTFSLQNLKQ